jgi:sec-independent protein translocase protein TatC
MASILDRVRRSNVPQPPVEPEVDETFEEMTLQEHLEELRTRLMYSAGSVILGFVIGLIFAQRLLSLMADMSGLEVFYTISPTEGFTVFMKVALYIGVALAMPVLVWQLVGFLAPGLTRNEKRYLFRAIPFVTIMFALGVVFAFFIVIPRALEFLASFGSSVFDPTFRAEEVVTFYMTLMLWIGVVFELPIVMFILSKLGIVNHRILSSFRKYALIVIMIAAALITPTPDPFNMFMVAAPMYVLYELGIFLSRFAGRSKTEQG